MSRLVSRFARAALSSFAAWIAVASATNRETARTRRASSARFAVSASTRRKSPSTCRSESLDNSMFAVPSDYPKFDMGSMMRRPPA